MIIVKGCRRCGGAICADRYYDEDPYCLSCGARYYEDPSALAQQARYNRSLVKLSPVAGDSARRDAAG